MMICADQENPLATSKHSRHQAARLRRLDALRGAELDVQPSLALQQLEPVVVLHPRTPSRCMRRASKAMPGALWRRPWCKHLWMWYVYLQLLRSPWQGIFCIVMDTLVCNVGGCCAGLACH